MDLNEEKQQLMAAVVFSHSWCLRRTLQLVFVILVSLLFCYYSQFSIYWKTFQFSIFTQALERKYAFLIFNGILAVVAKSLVHDSPPMYVSSSEFSSAANFDISPGDQVVPIGNSIEPKEDVIDQIVEEEHAEQAQRDDPPEAHHQENEDMVMDLEQQDSEELYGSSEEKISQEQEEEEEQADEDGEIVQQDDNDDEYLSEQHTTPTANEENTNTDELNRRFEEFIRKMKEEIRIEAQRQLIVV